MMMLRAGASLCLVAVGLVAGLRSAVNGAPAGGLLGTQDVAAAPVAQPDPYLTLLATPAGTAEQDGVQAMTRGLAALRAEQPAQAKLEFQRAATLLPALEDWALLYAATAAAAARQPDTVDVLLARVDPWLALERGWRARVDALRRSGGTDRALPIALDAAARASEPERRAAAWLEAAQIQLALRDTASAIASLRGAMDEAPVATVALDAARLLASLPRIAPEHHLALGRLYARHSNSTRAIGGIDRYLAAGSGTAEQRAGARVEAARALFDARKYVEAERRLAAAIGEALPDSVAAEARLLLGRAQYRQNKVTAGRATLAAVADAHPATRAAAEALYIVADLDHDAGRLTVARGLYTRAVDSRRGDAAAGDAAVRLGGLLLSSGEATAAVRVFETYHAAQPSGERRQQAAFWAGRAHLQAGDSTAARRYLREALSLDPVTWYGQRSADLLDTDTWTDSLAPATPTGDTGRALAEAVLHRMDLLTQLGLEDAFQVELARARTKLSGQDGAVYAVAEGLHARSGRLLTAVLLGREIKRREGAWNTRLLRIVYPFPYRDEIIAHATTRGLDPYLVAGLIRQESLFNPSAKSSAGAMGLMQVRPATGRELARKDGVRSFQPAHLNTPDTNVRLGTLYFRDLLARYDGRVGYVLAAYNAGPSRVARWRDLPEAGDPDLFAERIPFRETREYVKVVQQNARIYRAIYVE